MTEKILEFGAQFYNKTNTNSKPTKAIVQLLSLFGLFFHSLHCLINCIQLKCILKTGFFDRTNNIFLNE